MTSLYLPSTPRPASYRVKSRQRTKSSTASSGRIISREFGGQYFELTLVYPPMTRAQFSPLNAFVTALGGRNGVFNVTIPDDMSGRAGEYTGNFANFSNDWKLHLLTSDAPATVTPPARLAGGIIITSPVYMRCSLAGDVQQVRLDKTGLVRFELDLVERL